jgi:hypothetical protein
VTELVRGDAGDDDRSVVTATTRASAAIAYSI